MFYWHNGKNWEIDALTSEDVNDRLDETKDFIEEGVWIFAPRLDQLLAEIEKCRYIWAIDVSATNGDTVTGYAVDITRDLSYADEEEFRASTPENAAASALLWIPEGRNQHES